MTPYNTQNTQNPHGNQNPLFLRDMPEEERRRLVGALYKRFLVEQHLREAMQQRMAQMNALEKIRMADKMQKQQAKMHKRGAVDPQALKHLLLWTGGGAGAGGLAGAMAPEVDPQTGEHRSLGSRVARGAAGGGLTGGLMGGMMMPSKAQRAARSMTGDAAIDPAVRLSDAIPKMQSQKAQKMETMGIMERIKNLFRGQHTPTPDQLGDWYKSSSLKEGKLTKIANHISKEALEPMQIGNLAGLGLGSLAGLAGAKATEGENESYGGRMAKRLGLMAGGGLLGAGAGRAIGGLGPVYQSASRAFGGPSARKMMMQEGMPRAAGELAAGAPKALAKDVPAGLKALKNMFIPKAASANKTSLTAIANNLR